MIEPRPCFTDEPPSEQGQAMMILHAEAAGRAGLVGEGEWIGDQELLAAFASADSEVQEEWLRDCSQDVQECDSLTLPEWVSEEAIGR